MSNSHADFLGFGEIGGIGQLIYHGVRFSDYEYLDTDTNEIMVRPICTTKNPPDITPKDGLTGKNILVGLCELARRIDDFKEKGHAELIMEWCRENMHPYGIDSLYAWVTEDLGKMTEFDAELIARDNEFSIADFMYDLGKLYNTVRFYFALDAVCYANNEPAYNLYSMGRHFEGFPFFEKYKYPEIDFPEVDVSAANGDLLKEMQMINAAQAKYLKEHPVPQPDGEFYKQPYDDYDILLKKLIDLLPDFKLRIKIDPKNSKPVFAADINSVFDIAWYTFARMLTEEPPLEQKGKDIKRPDGIMLCCQHCGRFFVRTATHNKYCDRRECQKARNAKNQREFRKRKAIKKAQHEKK